MSNTMGGFGSAAGNQVSGIGRGSQGGVVGNMNSSTGALSGDGGDQSTTTPSGGATNQDLNKRLAEMKAKLQALKKK